MAGRFGVGVGVGVLAGLTPPFALVSVVVGVYALVRHGLTRPGETFVAGVVWASAWVVVYYVASLALLAFGIGLLLAPAETALVAGMLLVLAALHRRMKRNRGGADGTV